MIKRLKSQSLKHRTYDYSRRANIKHAHTKSADVTFGRLGGRDVITGPVVVW